MFKQKNHRNPYLFSNKKTGNSYFEKKQMELNEKIVSEQLNEYSKPTTSYAKRVSALQQLPSKNPFRDGWTYITKNPKSGKTDFYTHNHSLEYCNEPSLDQLVENMIFTLNNNYERYKQEYEDVHGEGEYDLAFKFSNPITFESDSEDEEEDEQEDSDEN